MQINRLKLRNVIAITICLVSFTVFSSCEKTDDLIVGKWVTSDKHEGDNDTIVFTEDFVVEQYFNHFSNEEVSCFVTYSLTENKITFFIHFQDLTDCGITYIPYGLTFEYTLNGNRLTIKGFSNLFSSTEEKKRDVRFKKVK